MKYWGVLGKIIDFCPLKYLLIIIMSISDGNLFRNLENNLTNQATGQILNVEGVNKIVFLEDYDTTYTFDDEVKINFPKFKQAGSINMTNNIVQTFTNIKLQVEINIYYKYDNTDFAPRFDLNIYKNSVLIHTRYCGVGDNIDTINNVFLINVIDVKNNDLLEIKFIKDSLENSTDHIIILKNSYVQYKTF
jgi:hypothetical protein